MTATTLRANSGAPAILPPPPCKTGRAKGLMGKICSALLLAAVASALFCAPARATGVPGAVIVKQIYSHTNGFVAEWDAPAGAAATGCATTLLVALQGLFEQLRAILT